MCSNNLKYIYAIQIIGRVRNKNNKGEVFMCNYCGSNKKEDGYCVKCGKEICEDCASPTDRRIHRNCLNVTPTRTSGAYGPPVPHETPDTYRTRDPGIIDDPGDFGPR
jgi:hypothetical protein